MIAIILFLILFDTAFSTVDKNCKPAEGPKALKCFQKLTDITDSAGTLDLNQFANTDKLNKLCKDFKQPCASSLKCGSGKEVVEAVDGVLDLCDAVHFLSVGFLDCDEKLNTKNSTCVQEWDPFPDEVEDPVKMAEIQKKACENFFGKDNCLEKEVKELCDEDMWTQFKKHYLALNKIVEACKFD